jgi:hypothetical protein
MYHRGREKGRMEIARRTSVVRRVIVARVTAATARKERKKRVKKFQYLGGRRREDDNIYCWISLLV